MYLDMQIDVYTVWSVNEPYIIESNTLQSKAMWQSAMVGDHVYWLLRLADHRLLANNTKSVLIFRLWRCRALEGLSADRGTSCFPTGCWHDMTNRRIACTAWPTSHTQQAHGRWQWTADSSHQGLFHLTIRLQTSITNVWANLQAWVEQQQWYLRS